MLKNLVHSKDSLVVIEETMSAQEAIDVLETHSLRNAPVVDSTNSLFRGSIYRYHIYKFKFNNSDADLSQLKVTQFLKNATRVINENATLYELIFALRDLPYVAVLNDHNSFTGIIRHEDLIAFLGEAWVAQKSGYVLSILTRGEKGELSKLSRLINRKCDITTAVTFEKTKYDTPSHLMVTLPNYVDAATVRMLVYDLTKRKYEVELAVL